LAGAFLATVFLAVLFLAGDFATALVTVFLAGDFFAAVFLAGDFFAVFAAVGTCASWVVTVRQLAGLMSVEDGRCGRPCRRSWQHRGAR
jgi:hypothetical protein